LVLTLLLAGLRIGEALALRWQDVDHLVPKTPFRHAAPKSAQKKTAL
jgi:integrase